MVRQPLGHVLKTFLKRRGTVVRQPHWTLQTRGGRIRRQSTQLETHPGSFSMSPTISLASDLDKKGGQTVLTPSKLADIPIRINRAIPDDAIVKRVTLKTELTDGASLASLSKRIDSHLNRPRTKKLRRYRREGLYMRSQHRWDGGRVT